MWQLAALGLYSLQWLGVVLGVGAEAVLMVAHLTALHEHKPQWLSQIPAVRAVQRWGLLLIILTGIIATGFQAIIDPTVYFIPVFGFKWALIGLVWLAFLVARTEWRGAWVEGFAGATWLALFVVHSVAPVSLSYSALISGYGIWIACFGVLWAMTIAITGHIAAAPTKQQSIEPAPVVSVPKKAVSPLPPKPKVVPAPIAAAIPKPPPVVVAPKAPIAPTPPPPPPKIVPVVASAPAPAPTPPPAPVKIEPVHVAAKPAPLHVVTEPPPKPIQPAPAAVIKEAKLHKPSLWHRFMALFARKPKVAAPAPIKAAEAPKTAPVAAPIPTMAAVSAPVAYKPGATVQQKPAPVAHNQPTAVKPPVSAPTVSKNLPVVEHLELLAPASAVSVATAMPIVEAEPSYVPDWNSIPGVRIMPQKPEDLSKQNRAPLVQAAA